MKKFPTKVAILGVGLIGGSIAMGLKKHFGSKITILGTCSSLKKAQIAQKRGVIDIAIDTNSQLPEDIQLVIIATPIQTILKILKLHSSNLSQNTLIIDVGSTKKTLIEKAQNMLPNKLSFIGTHPMAGSEMSGFENASVNLFRNKPWIVCNDQLSINKSKFAILKTLIEILGAKMILMDAKVHDELTAWASHIFLVTSSILVKKVTMQRKWGEIAKIASTGFRDTTRLASDNPKMKTDIVLTNKINILKVLRNLKDEITDFSRLLEQNKQKAILEYFELTKKVRDGWLANYFS